MISRSKVLVTGADGFIGSHVVEALVEAGADVRAFCLYNSWGFRGWIDRLSERTLKSIEVVSGDLRDMTSVGEAVAGCDLVLHLGALIAIPHSYKAPDAYVAVNITGTLNVLQSALKSGSRVVCTSTSEVYGTAKTELISESHPLNAQSPYAATKIAADQLALSFHRSFGLPVSVLRPFNTYGPRQSMRAIIPATIMQLARGNRRLQLGALDPTRDFTFVEDTAKGYLQIAACDSADGQVFNIGSGFEISIGETVGEICEIFGVSVDIEQDVARLRPKESEVYRLIADCSKARSAFGWAPVYGGGLPGFRRGLQRTVDWFREPANLEFYKQQGYVV